MKVRWTDESLRLRITPTELDALRHGEVIGSALGMPGGGWTIRIDPTAEAMSLRWTAGGPLMELSASDVMALGQDDREGLYRPAGDGMPRLLVEKDFPCAHPHSEEAGEPATERFAPTPTFVERRGLVSEAGTCAHPAPARALFD